MKEHSDLTIYNANKKALEKLNEEVQKGGDAAKQKFLMMLLTHL